MQRHSPPVLTALLAVASLLVAGCPDDDTEAPDNDYDPGECVEFDAHHAVGAEPAAVGLLFSARDCATGEPVADLSVEDFVLREDGAAADTDAGPALVEDRAHRSYVTVLVDASEAGPFEDVDEIAGAVEQLAGLADRGDGEVYFGVRLFDGSEGSSEWLRPHPAGEKLDERIDRLTQFEPSESDATNLYGAIADSIADLEQLRTEATARNHGGITADAHLLVVGGGGDTAGHVDADTAAEALEQTETVRAGAVAGSEDAAEAFEQLFGDIGPVYGEDDDVHTAIDAAVADMSAELDATYLLAYCSTARDTEITVSLELTDRESRHFEQSIDAARFTDGCADVFDADSCLQFDCGGAFCGGCNDIDQLCDDPDAGVCTDECLANDTCSSQTIASELGYRLDCSYDDYGECGGQCIDITGDDRHCGACNNPCPEDVDCTDGQCDCPEDTTHCGEQCADLDTDEMHCGECFEQCDPGETCDLGECVCAGGTVDCDGVCTDISSNPHHCGGCDNPCAPGQFCEDNSCQPLQQPPKPTIAAGGPLSCGLDDDGQLHCWGSAGDSATDPPSGSYEAVVAGYHHGCALTEDGSVSCWGRNDEGQASPPDESFVHLAPGRNHNCGLDAQGTPHCWGRNEYGESDPPDEIFHQLDAAATTSCGVDAHGRAHCWGDVGTEHPLPEEVNFHHVSAAANHVCGLSSDDTLYCRDFDGEDVEPDVPTENLDTVRAGGTRTCVLTDAGHPFCAPDWEFATDPEQSQFDEMSKGPYHVCARGDGETRCWGLEQGGQLNVPDEL